MADGTIILSTKVDNTGITKWSNSINSSFKKIGGIVGTALSIAAITRFIKASTQLASNLEEVQNVVDVAFGSMSYKMEEFANTAIETYGISRLTAKQIGSSFMAMADGMGFAEDKASDMSLALIGLSADMASFYDISVDEAKTALTSVYTGETETLKRYGILITEVNLQEYARQQGITKSINKMTQQEKVMLRYNYVMQATANAQGDFVRTQDSWANQTRILQERWKEMQTTFGQTFIVIGQMVMPIISSLVSGMTTFAKYLQSVVVWVGKLFGKQITFGTTELNNQMGGVASSGVDASNAIKDVGNETAKANKKIKKELAGFDELNILSQEIADSADGASGGVGDLGDISSGFNVTDTGESNFNIEEMPSKISGIFSTLQPIIAGALTALGCILLFTGNLAWGVGFIIAGAPMYAVSIATADGSNLDQDTIRRIQNVEAVVGGLMLAIGVLLLFLGQAMWGIGFIVMGASIYGVSQLQIGEIDKDQTAIQRLQTMAEALDGILIAIGILLLFLSLYGWGVGFIIAGATLNGVSELETGEIDNDKTAIERIQEVAKVAGESLIAVGLLLLFLGQVPWGLGFIVTGAGLFSVSEIEPTVTKDDITDSCSEILSFLMGLTTYLITNALLSNWSLFVKLWGDFNAFIKLCVENGFLKTVLTLFGNSLNSMQLWAIAIGVIVGAIAYLAMNWDKLSPAQRTITILTSLAAAATAAAVAIALFHTSWSVGVAAATIAAGIATLAGTYLFKKANEKGLKTDVSGGGEAPTDISQYSYLARGGNYGLPALARGAVLPPNKPFMAIVGDQKSGVNVETPLTTMIEAFNTALDNRGGGFSGNIEIPLILNSREFGRAVIKSGDLERARTTGSRVGTKVVFG